MAEREAVESGDSALGYGRTKRSRGRRSATERGKIRESDRGSGLGHRRRRKSGTDKPNLGGE